MFKTVYHSSPDNISKFDFSHGVHFGGKFSALEAGDRKLSNLIQYRDSQQDHLFLYTCTLTNVPFYETEDVGGPDAWKKEIEEARKEGFSLIRYWNKYEPDSEYSYIVLDPKLINVIQVESLFKKEVEKILKEHLENSAFLF